jgi:hypothetical protein
MFKRFIASTSSALLISLAAVAPHALANDAEDAQMREALAALDASLPGKLINNPYVIEWKTEGPDQKSKLVEANGGPGGMAYQVRVKKSKRQHWDIATRIPMSTDVAEGDTILVSFWARAERPPKGRDTGKITITYQRNIDPYDSVFEEQIDLGTEWKLHNVAGTAKRGYSAPKTNLNFNLAHAKQTVEFGPFYVMNLGPNADPSKYMK